MVEVSQVELVRGAIARKAVSFPTDTVPALAIKPEFAQLIYQLKQRPANKPLILMGGSIADLLPYTTHTSAELTAWQKLIDRHLPGALTLVLPASDLVPQAIDPTRSNTVGIRVPNCAIACQILKQTGVLATTSANISGKDALTSMKTIAATFPDVLVLKDTGLGEIEAKGSGLPSTVVSWQNQQWQVLRQGSVKIDRS
ncbi:L-threonylcarbamoyladenylate synthase [Waterburya agarophytonicola K14]|uniref:L-threonylcarbamoyladenylate synthase n=1 Tax=Waterburya agarophytonicola KI4 TaxID=2874699 RepID=A0A964FH65_9CYAN|nr:L-threonylcarbamoyladenylate synthase [Waterburya agarophytonicola]MCC0177329.1 L-threonylcarbamoyladenylate synthase [Waterburya agarophytonicola KI4]